jgi:hypothetical protein
VGLPFYCDFGPPRGWPPSRLLELVETIRRKHPSGPMLVVLDYLQLVGEERRGEFQRAQDLRERIGGAAYVASEAARRYEAAIVIVSSTARSHYGLLASDAKDAGLVIESAAYGRQKKILNPSALIGLGKESGELEFAAATVTTLIRWPARMPNGENVILCATPKVRWGGAPWCALSFSGTKFAPLTIDTMDDLPEVPRSRRGAGRPSVDDGNLEERIVATLRRIGPTTRRRLVQETEGTDGKLYAAVKAAIQSGKILGAADGTLSAADIPQQNGETQR